MAGCRWGCGCCWVRGRCRGAPVVRGLWRGSLVLQGLRRGSQGVEAFLELLVGHVIVGVSKVAPVLGLLQQGGEEGRPWTWGSGG